MVDTAKRLERLCNKRVLHTGGGGSFCLAVNGGLVLGGNVVIGRELFVNKVLIGEIKYSWYVRVWIMARLTQCAGYER